MTTNRRAEGNLMSLFNGLFNFHHDEGGHVAAWSLEWVAGVGAVLLTAGAAAGEDVITIIGGVVLAVGLAAAPAFRHTSIDYGIFERLNDLEKDG